MDNKQLAMGFRGLEDLCALEDRQYANNQLAIGSVLWDFPFCAQFKGTEPGI